MRLALLTLDTSRPSTSRVSSCRCAAASASCFTVSARRLWFLLSKLFCSGWVQQDMGPAQRRQLLRRRCSRPRKQLQARAECGSGLQRHRRTFCPLAPPPALPPCLQGREASDEAAMAARGSAGRRQGCSGASWRGPATLPHSRGHEARAIELAGALIKASTAVHGC